MLKMIILMMKMMFSVIRSCNARCCQDILEIFQVTDQNVILRTRKIQGHSRQFCVEWYKKFPWL